MFGNLGQLTNLLRNAGAMKENMQRMQAEMKAARFTGDAGAEQVVATVDGTGELISLKIDPNLVTSGDREMIEDLTVAAVRAAVSRSREEMKARLQEVTGGLDLGGMMDMIQ